MTETFDVNQWAQDIMQKVPSDLHHITMDSLLPLLTVLMGHAQDVGKLTGPQRKAVVLYCLHTMLGRMPFPENQIITPVVDAVAPAAIEGIIRASRSAEEHLRHGRVDLPTTGTVFYAGRASQSAPSQTVRRPMPHVRFTWPFNRSSQKKETSAAWTGHARKVVNAIPKARSIHVAR